MDSSRASAAAMADQAPGEDAAKKNRVPSFHSFLVNGCEFTVDTKYYPVKLLGQGAYGVVCAMEDRSRNNKKVAVKKITDVFEDLVDAKRILREIRMLRHFSHKNIIKLQDLIPPVRTLTEIYMVLDGMETDLHKIIQSDNELTTPHLQYFLYQLLRGLKYVHSAHVIHRDLKPSNLLVNSNCELRICDFGLARGVDENKNLDGGAPDKGANQFELTEYVVTRWYRAPEVMVSCQEYDYKIDMWSVGCILAELFGRKPIFPGEDYIAQMTLIFNQLGTPKQDDMHFVTNENARQYIYKLKRQAKVPFSRSFKLADPVGLDLLDKLLQFDPKKRLTVDEALAHPWMKELQSAHKSGPKDTCPKPFDWSFEQLDLANPDVMRELMWDEIYLARPYMEDHRMVAREQQKQHMADDSRAMVDDAAYVNAETVRQQEEAMRLAREREDEERRVTEARARQEREQRLHQQMLSEQAILQQQQQQQQLFHQQQQAFAQQSAGPILPPVNRAQSMQAAAAAARSKHLQQWASAAVGAARKHHY